MKLIKKEILNEKFVCWDLEVEETHSYIVDGVVVHNSNGRVSLSKNPDGTIEWKAGSHRLKRKMPAAEEMKSNVYWFPYTVDCVRNLIQNMFDNHESIECKTSCTLFLEIYGGKVRGGLKELHYGKQNELSFAAFAIQVDGKYVPWLVFHELCIKYNVPMVPVVGIMPFDLDVIRGLCKGKSILAQDNGADHIMEGFVICAEKERDHPKCSRSILKMISHEYLLLKEKKAEKGEVVDFTDI